MAIAAELLKQTRLTSRLSGRELAERAGTAPARLSEIERTVHDPAVGTLDRVLRSAGWQLVVLPTLVPTAATVALSIRDAGTSTTATKSAPSVRSWPCRTGSPERHRT